MKHATFIGSTFLLISSTIAAGTVEYAIQKQPKQNPSKLNRRDTISPALLTNFDNSDGLAYYLNLTVGTPGQPQTVQLDTGSSDLYFSASNASFCLSEPGCTGGTFDSSKSSTFSLVSTKTFNVTFGDGSTEIGDYFKDVIQVGDMAISGVQMGLAYDINSTSGANTGLLGLGYSIDEAVESVDDYYPNFLEALVGAKAIASRLFSLYLNELEAYGSIVFGGVDTEKFDSEGLTTLDLLPVEGTNEIAEFFLILENVTATPSGGKTQTIVKTSESEPMWVMIDSGSTAWMLPTENYNSMVKLLNVDPDLLTKPCNEVHRGESNTTHFEFEFKGNGTNTALLRLESADLFTPLTNDDGSAATDESGAALCILRIEEAESDQGSCIVGDAIMRAGYWVFDLDNGQISIAQAILGANASKIVAVEAGTDGLKNVVNVQAPAQYNDIAEPSYSSSGTYGLSTAASTVGYATGVEAVPSVTSAGSFGNGGSGGPAGASASHSEGVAATTIPSLVPGGWVAAAIFTTVWWAVGALLMYI